MPSINKIKGNVLGGITAGVIALPLALAFGVSSGLGAASGLWGAIIVCFFASIFGGTKTQISGPTGPMTVIAASLVASFGTGNFRIIFITMCIAGIFQIILGLSNVAKYIKYIPYPVISGFMSGIGAIILILQINPLLGIKSQGNTIDSIEFLFKNISNISSETLLLSLVTLAIVFFTPKKIAQKIPSALIALIVSSLLAFYLKLNVSTIGEIPSGFPSFQLGLISISQFIHILPMALTLAILGSLDSLLTSLVADSITKTKHNSSKELIGQGLGNMLAAAFGGLCGAGATMRTVVNIKSGGTSRLSGVCHCIFLVLVVFCIAKIASNIPLCVLAAILVKVGIDIIDYKFIKIAKHAPSNDLIVVLTVFFVTVFSDLIFAVALGLVVSAILFAIKISKQFDIQINTMYPDVTEGTIEQQQDNKDIIVIKVDGIFFFGTASQLLGSIDDVFEAKSVIIDCQDVNDFDISAAFALEDMILRLKDKKINVILLLGTLKIGAKLLKLGLTNYIERKNIVFKSSKAVLRAQEVIKK